MYQILCVCINIKSCDRAYVNLSKFKCKVAITWLADFRKKKNKKKQSMKVWFCKLDLSYMSQTVVQIFFLIPKIKNTTCITILEEIMCSVTVCLMRLYVLNYKLFIQCYSAMRKRNANRPKNNNKTAAIRHNKTNPDIFEMHNTRTK